MQKTHDIFGAVDRTWLLTAARNIIGPPTPAHRSELGESADSIQEGLQRFGRERFVNPKRLIEARLAQECDQRAVRRN
ncbi:hypothetical protein D3C85_1503660 [compost metagenome]